MRKRRSSYAVIMPIKICARIAWFLFCIGAKDNGEEHNQADALSFSVSFGNLPGANSIPRRGHQPCRCSSVVALCAAARRRPHQLHPEMRRAGSNERRQDDGGGASATPQRHERSRRSVLMTAAAAAAAAAASTMILLAAPVPAAAKGPEIDAKSGELFTPKSECPCMNLEREQRDGDRKKKAIASRTVGPIQTVYDVRFITYLSRFLINFDPAAKAWFQECFCARERGGGFSNEADTCATGSEVPSTLDVNLRAQLRFAEFAESVEIGLANYFVDPDGVKLLMKEVEAKKSGEMPQSSDVLVSPELLGLFSRPFKKQGPESPRTEPRTGIGPDERTVAGREGISNLFALLASRFTSREEKIQLAILFSMITDPFLQPTAEIKSLLDEVGDADFIGAVDESVLTRLKSSPIALLPTNIGPEFIADRRLFGIPSLPPVPPNVSLPSARYRAVDPLFGGIGSKPVMKGAQSLSASQYSRLALSGAICTVLVRTALNPLELVKTKIQLKNDDELIDLALQSLPSSEPAYESNEKIDEDDHIAFGEFRKLLRPGEKEDAPPKSRRTLHDEAEMGLLAQNAIVAEEKKPSKVDIDEQNAPTRHRRLSFGNREATNRSPGTMAMISSLVQLRGPTALFQSADITFLASIMFGSFGFGATELFKRSFASFVVDDSGPESEVALFLAAASACIVMCAAATPFEVLRVRSMGAIQPKGWITVLAEFMEEKRVSNVSKPSISSNSTSTMDGGDISFKLRDVSGADLLQLWAAFPTMVTRELPFAIVKFLVFDIAANAMIALIDYLPAMAGQVQVGAGALGLAVSAFAGGIAGIAGAVVSHPADLILTLTSVSAQKAEGTDYQQSPSDSIDSPRGTDWWPIVQELLDKDGGISNLFVGLQTRASFFFFVIGLQFFIYDFVKNLFEVGTDDLTMVLDVFYAIKVGIVE